MLILALDTTLNACSAALYDSRDQRVLCGLQETMQQGHAERLAGMTSEVASNADVEFGQIDRIAVAIGPGTFTGVRIGLAMAQGMGRALGIPVIGVSTLQAIAANVTENPNNLPISVVMDARRNAVYTQTFSHRYVPQSEPLCVALTDLGDELWGEDRIIIGGGSDLIADRPAGWQPTTAPIVPDAGIVARLSQYLPGDGPPPTPLYLRAADAKPQAALVKLSPVAVSVERVDAAYATVLAAIHSECFPAGWSAQDLSGMLTSPGMFALLASPQEGKGEPAGFILLRQAADEAEVIMLCVRPNMRRRGIAGQLIKPAIEQIRSNGAAKIFLEVSTQKAAAKSLYASAGFSQVGLRANYYALEGGEKADAAIMALTI